MRLFPNFEATGMILGGQRRGSGESWPVIAYLLNFAEALCAFLCLLCTLGDKIGYVRWTEFFKNRYVAVALLNGVADLAQVLAIVGVVFGLISSILFARGELRKLLLICFMLAVYWTRASYGIA